MEDDLITGLTRQVKEEIVENYLAERRLIDIQVEDIEKRAEDLIFEAAKTGMRLSRLAYLMTDAEMVGRLMGRILKTPKDPYWDRCLEGSRPRGVRFIRVRALTDKGKFRKLVVEAYRRLHQWMDTYRKAHEDLRADCEAVNRNIVSFRKNFDLLSIVGFLKSLDIQQIDKQRILGENFTSSEVSSLERSMYVHSIDFEKLDVPSPLPLPIPDAVEDSLGDLAGEIYTRHKARVKSIME